MAIIRLPPCLQLQLDGDRSVFPWDMRACVTPRGTPHSPKGSLVCIGTKWTFSRNTFTFHLRPRVFSRAVGCGARRGAACTPRRKRGSRPRPVGRALGLQSREFWQITQGRRSDLTPLRNYSEKPVVRLFFNLDGSFLAAV